MSTPLMQLVTAVPQALFAWVAQVDTVCAVPPSTEYDAMPESRVPSTSYEFRTVTDIKCLQPVHSDPQERIQQGARGTTLRSRP